MLKKRVRFHGISAMMMFWWYCSLANTFCYNRVLLLTVSHVMSIKDLEGGGGGDHIKKMCVIWKALGLGLAWGFVCGCVFISENKQIWNWYHWGKEDVFILTSVKTRLLHHSNIFIVTQQGLNWGYRFRRPQPATHWDHTLMNLQQQLN